MSKIRCAEEIESSTYTNMDSMDAVLVITRHPNTLSPFGSDGRPIKPITDQTYRDEAEQVARFLRKVFCLKTTDYIKEML